MAEYNNQSIDIDLEEMFNNLSDKDQEEFLVDMFRNLPGEEERADVVKDNMWYLEDDTAADIITDLRENEQFRPKRDCRAHRRRTDI